MPRLKENSKRKECRVEQGRGDGIECIIRFFKTHVWNNARNLTVTPVWMLLCKCQYILTIKPVSVFPNAFQSTSYSVFNCFVFSKTHVEVCSPCSSIDRQGNPQTWSRGIISYRRVASHRFSLWVSYHHSGLGWTEFVFGFCLFHICSLSLVVFCHGVT